MKLPLSADVSVTVIEDFDDFGPFSVFQNKKNPSEQSTTMKKKRSDNLSNVSYNFMLYLKIYIFLIFELIC